MIARYVLASFGRHKARTVIMALALLVVTAMLVALNNSIESLQRQVVEIVEMQGGEQDITITRTDTSPQQFIEVARISAILRASDPAVVAVYPRFQQEVELWANGTAGEVTLVARAPEEQLGQVTMLEGTCNLSGDRVVVLRVAADMFGLEVGDALELSYPLPVARLPGYELPEDLSTSRVTRRFTVSGIALATGLGGSQNGVLMSLQSAQDWLGLPDQAERLIVVLDEGIYGSASTTTAIFRVRRIAERLLDALGSEADTYRFALYKAEALDFSDEAFAVLRAVSSVYGLLVMGVVGLLIYSLINTNVEERRRDLAFLRILGAQRRHLFALVLTEVALLGLVGVGLGIIVGQVLSFAVVAPIVNLLIASAGEGLEELGVRFHMAITGGAMARAALIAGVVLLLAAVAPARKAANTKVRYAISPGSADNLQIEDLARLRSRKFDVRIVIAGVVLTVMWLLIFIGTEFLFVQGNESILSVFIFGGMALLVIGVSLLFYALTVPFERLLIGLSGWAAPRLAFFAGPNLMRARQRNTVISLMIVFSATLPTFLGTMTALEQHNYDTTARFDSGAPLTAQIFVWWRTLTETPEGLLPGFLDEFTAVPGVGRAVGLTAEYRTGVTNWVELRNTPLQIRGITGSLDGIVYDDLTSYAAGGPESFAVLLAEPDTIIVSAGYAGYMDVRLGDRLRVQGTGRDHVVTMRVVGIVERMAGVRGFSYDESYVRDGNSVGLVSLDTYIRLTTDPTVETLCPGGLCSLDERERPVITAIMATTAPGADEAAVVRDLRELFADRANVWVRSTAEDIRSTEQSMRTMRVLMLVMTVLSFITSILGVFAVVYVAVYVRRMEIGMLKAIGMGRRDLVRTFALESVIMSVSAALAGVTAGTVLGYVFYATNTTMQDVPTRLTFDWLTTLAILVMVILASVISASLAARGTVRQRVTQILREAR